MGTARAGSGEGLGEEVGGPEEVEEPEEQRRHTQGTEGGQLTRIHLLEGRG